jgi:hypothetical protein
MTSIIPDYHPIATSPLIPYRPTLRAVASSGGRRCMGPLAPCIYPARQGLTEVDVGGWGWIWLLPSATGGNFCPMGVLMVSGGSWLTESHVPRGFPTAWASWRLLIVVPPPHRRFSPSNRPHIPFGQAGGHGRVVGPSWERTCLKPTSKGENSIVVSYIKE